jgi:hypothetical protein
LSKLDHFKSPQNAKENGFWLIYSFVGHSSVNGPNRKDDVHPTIQDKFLESALIN